MKNIEIVTVLLVSLVALASTQSVGGGSSGASDLGIVTDGFQSTYWFFNITLREKTQVKPCINNGNCSTNYCNGGTCQVDCSIYDSQGNYSTGCYCQLNADCSSGFCWEHKCTSIPQKFYGLYCENHADCGNAGLCDHTMHQCQPECKIGGCYCTQDLQCDSQICLDFHCKAISFVPAWTLAVSAFIALVIAALCIIYYKCFAKYYVIPNQFTNYGYIVSPYRKDLEFRNAQDITQKDHRVANH